MRIKLFPYTALGSHGDQALPTYLDALTHNSPGMSCLDKPPLPSCELLVWIQIHFLLGLRETGGEQRGVGWERSSKERGVQEE